MVRGSAYFLTPPKRVPTRTYSYVHETLVAYGHRKPRIQLTRAQRPASWSPCSEPRSTPAERLRTAFTGATHSHTYHTVLQTLLLMKEDITFAMLSRTSLSRDRARPEYFSILRMRTFPSKYRVARDPTWRPNLKLAITLYGYDDTQLTLL